MKKPHLLKPMLAKVVETPFDSKEWIFEIKLDGFRAVADLNFKEVSLYSRNLHLLNARFTHLIEDLKRLNIDAIFDGEIVALDEKGISRFQSLQNQKDENNIYYYVFDILYYQGEDLRSFDILKRKALLKKILKKGTSIRYLDHIDDQGRKFFQMCKEKSLEGIIGKKKTSVYENGMRSGAWVKIKAEMSQEVVICGFTQPRRSRKHFGALITGVYENGVLHFAGHVGGGFTEKKQQEVLKTLTPLVTSACPFKNPPKTNTPVTWVKPHYLCEVKFKEWTSDGVMRMPIFLGLRDDKPAKSVTQETKMEPLLQKYNFLTHLDKYYWPKEAITKGDLLNYYASIAPFILPYLKDRPQSLRRFPNGIEESGFFQKNMKSYPDWLKTFEVQHHDKIVNYLLMQDVKSLLFAVNLGCIEIHPWFSRKQKLENPDFLVFDLDPVDIPFDAVIETALHLHALLDSIEVPNYCKTSGGRGIHIAVPLHAKYDYDLAKKFAELIAFLIHQQLPKITSLERSPKNRKNRVYIDCYQNNFGQTLAAPYSVRARPGAPVSTPLEWNEVRAGLNPLDYSLFNVLKRLEAKGDIFNPVLKQTTNLRRALLSLDAFL